MARPLRLEFQGALYHVTGRGNARAAVYEDDADRQHFLDLLWGTVARRAWLCHAYCLMGNHYHLVVETLAANLGQGMRDLGGVYTQAFNRRHGRAGHLFQGRYHAVLVQREAHLLELCRYVVLNPVRAGLVDRVEDWRWSSYGATAGLVARPEHLCADWVLGQFGRRRGAAQRAYAAFVDAGAAPIWDRLRGQIYLGDEAFVAQLMGRVAAADTLVDIPRQQRLPTPRPLASYGGEGDGRASAMAAAYADGHSLRMIGRHFGVHESTVSRAVRRLTGAKNA
jgi:REP element-mobilizing transposase RayT